MNNNTPMLVRVNREGSFEIQKDQLHMTANCGSSDRKNFRYEVMIEATNKHLTSDGFVMENGVIDEYFKNKYEVNKEPCKSCELIAMEALGNFLDMFNDASLPTAGVEVKRILVRIHGATVSFIEAEWKRK